MIIIFLVLPLIVVAGFILSIRFVSHKFLRRTVCSVLVIIFLPLLWICFSLVSYFYALDLESNWSKAHPTTRVELEKYLHLYSTRQISPGESDWGKDYKLASGERMIQYLILWDAPLDVVYDKGDQIKAIYTSYE